MAWIYWTSRCFWRGFGPCAALERDFRWHLGTHRTLSRDTTERRGLGRWCEPINRPKTGARRSSKNSKTFIKSYEKCCFLAENASSPRPQPGDSILQWREWSFRLVFATPKLGKALFTPRDALRNWILDQNNQILSVLSAKQARKNLASGLEALWDMVGRSLGLLKGFPTLNKNETCCILGVKCFWLSFWPSKRQKKRSFG